MKTKLNLSDLFMWFLSLERMIPFSLMARIRGDFSVDQLRAALDRLRVKYPVMGARVTGQGRDLYFVTDGVPEFPIRVVERRGEQDWISVAADEMSTPFPLDTGPYIRFVVLRSAGVSDLVLTCHHAIGDGLPVTYMLRDLLRQLGEPGAEVEPPPVLPPLMELYPPECVARASQLGPDEIAALFGQPSSGEQGQASPEEVKPLKPITEESPLHVIAWALSADQTGALVARCREEGASVHAALSAAFLRAFAEVEGREVWDRTIMNPLSVRDRMAAPVGETFQNFWAGVLASANCAPDRDFWAVARDLRQALQQAGSDEVLLVRAVLIEWMMPGMKDEEVFVHPGRTGAAYDLTLTNLGRLDFPTRYGDFRLEALYGPVINAFEDEKGLGVITFDDRLAFTFAFREAGLDPEQAERIKSGAMRWLGEAAGW